MNRLLLVLLSAITILSACSNDLSNRGSMGDVIDIHGNVQHLDRMEQFIQHANQGEPASIRVVRYTIEGDPIYYDLSLKNGQIDFKYDTTEDKFGSGSITKSTCDNLTRKESATELAFVLTGCSGTNQEQEILYLAFDVRKQDRFGFIMNYGVNEKNEVDTEQRKLVKDLQNGETATLTDFELTTDELQTIYRKMVLMNYLGEKQLQATCNQKPHESYYLKVFINSGIREYRWSDCDQSEDGQAMNEILNEIKGIIMNREDYKSLPDVQGVYM
ncbi:DUF4362 domain-containing protein [Cohnella mopanensis]|uniref:DUF4362 domain-containing protein n=1 Tax=Cohnella mopanensis TaxID=2911966 RepID=UPI001EF8F8CE|nr:DUF4362 domain-containing protein [Cohnella mopanensis]